MSPKPPQPQSTYTIKVVSKYSAGCFMEINNVDETSKDNLLNAMRGVHNFTEIIFDYDSNSYLFPIEDVFVSCIKEK